MSSPAGERQADTNCARCLLLLIGQLGEPEVSMALVKCSECGNQVSDGAEACPHCGIKSVTSGQVADTIFRGFGCLVLCLVGLVILYALTSQK